MSANLSTPDFWTSDKGLLLRLDDLAESITWETVNNSLRILASEAGIKNFEWVTEIGPTTCDYCDAQSGRRYRVGQFMPRLPAHVSCRCHWDILTE